MEMLFVVVVFIGWSFVWIGKNEQRIAEIEQAHDQEIALFLLLLKECYKAIPKTVANEELLEQIELVIDDEDIEEDI